MPPKEQPLKRQRWLVRAPADRAQKRETCTVGSELYRSRCKLTTPNAVVMKLVDIRDLESLGQCFDGPPVQVRILSTAHLYNYLIIAYLHILAITGVLYRSIKMPKKQSGNNTSSLAGKILSGSKKATQSDAKKLAASVLSQDEKKGKRK